MSYGWKKTISVTTLLLLIVAVIVYIMVIPQILARQYTEGVYAAARPLEGNFKDISKSTELPLMLDSGIPEAVVEDNAVYIIELVDASKQEIDLLEAASRDFSPPPYSYISGQYEEVDILRGHAKKLVAQSESALSSYRTLTMYLEIFNKATGDVVSELNSFNEVADINIYAGQFESIERVADKIRADVAILSQSTPPHDMKGLSDEAVIAMNEAASAFDDLAVGLMIPADDPIYTAARKIEAATNKMDNIRGSLYDKSLGESRTVKDIQDLSEKLELVLTVQDY